MSLIAGLGDEVLFFVATVLLGGLVLVAWLSSAVRERPRVQAVLLQPLRPGVLVAEQVDAAEARRIRQAEEENAGTAGVRRRQVVFAREEEAAPVVTAAAAEAVVSPDPIVAEHVQEEEEADASTTPASSVTIRLKFLNDSQREVRAPLTEQLGRFKRRHFADALAENKTIRLIFNGHVLNGDQEPLSHYGLFDNCVVHCLESSAAARSQESARGGEDIEEDNLDLSHICYPLLGSLLVIIWWCQLVYSHYFSLASTVSLVSLTILFLASITNTYLY